MISTGLVDERTTLPLSDHETHVAKKKIKLRCEPDTWKKRLISISFIHAKKYFKNDLQGVIAELVPTPRIGAAETGEYGIKSTFIQIPRRLK